MRAFFINLIKDLSSWYASLHLERWWSWKTLVSTNPPVIWQGMWIYTGLILFCLIGGISLFFWRLRPGLRGRLSSLFWTNAIIGLILFFFRFERIPLLGMDLWRFLQEFAIVIWSFFILRYWRRSIPKEMLAEKVQAYRDRFLPKPKKS